MKLSGTKLISLHNPTALLARVEGDVDEGAVVDVAAVDHRHVHEGRLAVDLHRELAGGDQRGSCCCSCSSSRSCPPTHGSAGGRTR